MELSFEAELSALADRREPYVHALAFDPARRALAVAIPGRVFVHDLTSGARRSEHVVVGHAGNSRIGMPRELALSAAARQLVVAVSVPNERGTATPNQRTLQLFREGDAVPHTVLPRDDAAIAAWALDPGGTQLLTANVRGELTLMALDTLEVQGRLQLRDEWWRAGHVAAVAIGHDHRKVGVAVVSSAEDDPAWGELHASFFGIFGDCERAELLASNRQQRSTYVDVERLAFGPADAQLVAAAQMPSPGIATLQVAPDGAFAWHKARPQFASSIWLAPDGARAAWLLEKEKSDGSVELSLELRPTTGKGKGVSVKAPPSEAWAVSADGTAWAVGGTQRVTVGECPRWF